MKSKTKNGNANGNENEKGNETKLKMNFKFKRNSCYTIHDDMCTTQVLSLLEGRAWGL